MLTKRRPLDICSGESAYQSRERRRHPQKELLTDAEIESFLKAVPIDPCLLFAC
jgi:hypothetical protein